MAQKLLRLRQWSRRLEKKKISQKAICFPAQIRHRIDWKEIDSFRTDFNTDNLFVVHGTSFRKDNKATIVSGPQGIGKSTSLRKLAKKGKLKPIDDGMILIARDKNTRQYFVFETGYYPLLRTQSVVSRVLRSIFGYKSAFINPNISSKRFQFTHKVGSAMASASVFLGRILAKNRSSQEHAPRKFLLDKVILGTHPRMDAQVLSIKKHNASWKKFEELRAALSNQTEIINFDPTQKNSRKRLNQLMAEA